MIRDLVQNDTKNSHWVVVSPSKCNDAEEILRILDRAAKDDGFIAQLTCQGSQALRGYALSQQAKAALVSGDLGWIEARVGKLSTRFRTWIDCRLQQEIW